VGHTYALDLVNSELLGLLVIVLILGFSYIMPPVCILCAYYNNAQGGHLVDKSLLFFANIFVTVADTSGISQGNLGITAIARHGSDAAVFE